MKITVIGELCRDIFVYGETKRLSPEAPIAVLNPLYTIENPGMAGNTVENLKSIDGQITINFIHQLEVITKTRYVDEKSNHMFLRVDEGEKNIDPLNLSAYQIQLISESDAVIVSDYNKGLLTESTLTQIASLAKFSIIDTKTKLSSYTLSKFNFVKVNESEFYKYDTEVRDINIDKFIVTLGSKGAEYLGRNYPSPDPKETIDVSGAGDTFTASFTLKYLETLDIAKSITFANEMASIVVSKRGVTTPL